MDGGGSGKLESAKERAEDETQEATGVVKATIGRAGEKASEYAGKVKDKAEDVKDSAEEKVLAIQKGTADGTDKDKDEVAEDSAEEKASAIKKGAADGTDKNKTAEEEEEKEGKKTSANPQEIDPGDTAMKNAGGSGTMSGKQQGISNDDTWHAVCPTTATLPS